MTNTANEPTAVNKAPVFEALTKPFAAKITAPSAALAAADALLEATAVEAIASKVRIRTAQAQQRQIPAEVLEHKRGVRRNQSSMMRAAVILEAAFKLECYARGLAGGQSELAEHELEFMASPPGGNIWIASTRNAFGFMSRPVLNTQANIERAGGSSWRTGPSQSITNSFFMSVHRKVRPLLCCLHANAFERVRPQVPVNLNYCTNFQFRVQRNHLQNVWSSIDS